MDMQRVFLIFLPALLQRQMCLLLRSAVTREKMDQTLFTHSNGKIRNDFSITHGAQKCLEFFHEIINFTQRCLITARQYSIHLKKNQM